jgi:hypothetical protein
MFVFSNQVIEHGTGEHKNLCVLLHPLQTEVVKLNHTI